MPRTNNSNTSFILAKKKTKFFIFVHLFFEHRAYRQRSWFPNRRYKNRRTDSTVLARPSSSFPNRIRLQAMASVSRSIKYGILTTTRVEYPVGGRDRAAARKPRKIARMISSSEFPWDRKCVRRLTPLW